MSDEHGVDPTGELQFNLQGCLMLSVIYFLLIAINSQTCHVPLQYPPV